MEAAVVDDSAKDPAVSNRGGRKCHRNENEDRADQADGSNTTDGKARTSSELILRCICPCHMHFYAFMFYFMTHDKYIFCHLPFLIFLSSSKSNSRS